SRGVANARFKTPEAGSGVARLVSRLRRRRRIEICVLLAGRRELGLVLFFFAFVHGFLEATHGAAEVRADRLEALRAEDDERDHQDHQQLTKANTHCTLPVKNAGGSYANKTCANAV